MSFSCIYCQDKKFLMRNGFIKEPCKYCQLPPPEKIVDPMLNEKQIESNNVLAQKIEENKEIPPNPVIEKIKRSRRKSNAN